MSHINNTKQITIYNVTYKHHNANNNIWKLVWKIEFKKYANSQSQHYVICLVILRFKSDITTISYLQIDILIFKALKIIINYL